MGLRAVATAAELAAAETVLALAGQGEVRPRRVGWHGTPLAAPGFVAAPATTTRGFAVVQPEGDDATPEELLLFELDPERPGKEEEVTAWREVLNYTRALRMEEGSEQPLGLSLIRQLHGVLLEGVRGGKQSSGNSPATHS